ncbi:MAG: hypothetical protein M1836_004774 [Candelina mexicana]|nr:MAG: hypothetical protein M1836_004774 [Candelina mexicana]
MAPKVLNIGLIGAGEVAQVIHLPTLSLLPHLYRIISISDLSPTTLSSIQSRYPTIKTTTDPLSIISSSEIDVVFILTSDEYHETYTIAALAAGKHVMVEKPLTLSAASAERILEAERKATNGARVFVGYMRRYAPSFVGAFKREVEGIDRVLYARCRGIVGPNAYFVNQSGTSPVKNTDFPEGSLAERDRLLDGLLQEAFEAKEVTKERRDFCRFLGSLGSHDLSLMRETLGFPESVAGVSVNEPFYSAILNYRGKGGESFAVTYESGIDAVPRFDSHLAVYGKKKTVSIQYDTPYVKGLPIKVRVDEENEYGEVVTREILSSYEDAYTAELKELHACLTDRRDIKTSAEDAALDLKLFKMMFEQYERQK